MSVALVLLLALGVVAPTGVRAEEDLAEPARGPVLRARIDGIIHAYTADFIERLVKQAEAQDARLVLIGMDTPGGLLNATKDIVKTILNSKVPVAVYVSPAGASASSAGTFITMVGHVAAMAPGTNIGAAHPVSVMGGGETTSPASEIMMEKVMNDTVAYIRGIAGERGRNVEWAVDAVRKSVSITAREAVEKKVVDVVASSDEDLLDQIDGRIISRLGLKPIALETRGASVVDVEMTFREKVLSQVANPNIAYMLMMLGILGIIFEVTHPGIGLPGVVGVLAMAGAFVGLKTLPLSYTGLLLILFGIAFLVLEAKMGGTGVLAMGGAACLGAGSYLLVDTEVPEMRVSWEYIVVIVSTITGIFVFLVAKVLHDMAKPIVTGKEGMVGAIAEAREEFVGEGQVFVEGEIWNALNRSGSKVSKGDKLTVLKVQGGRVEVERIE